MRIALRRGVGAVLGRSALVSATLVLATLVLVSLGLAAPAAAEVVARIDVASQSMTVEVDGTVAAVWAVSTARRGFHTPTGVYSPHSLDRMHRSHKYDNAPMPYSVFFKGGYAVHGTYELARLGRPASHGCVRLSTANAAAFYHLVRGRMADTRIIIG